MRLPLLVALLASLVAAPARAEKFTIDDDTFVNIGVLLQPQVTAVEGAAPDDGVGTDIFIRRGRLLLTGMYDPHIGFVLVTDQANYGKGGDFTTQFFLQDALAYYKVSPALIIDAGFMLLPFTRHDYQSAGALNAIDFHANVFKFLPTGKAFRDMGVEVRGLAIQDHLYYRVGVFSGLAGKAANATTGTGEINGSDVPRVTGNVRFNIVGKEDAYAFSGIYFTKDPIVSVGVGADWQNDALGSTGKTRYLALATDVFADVPVGEDMEVVAQGAVIRYDDYPLAGAHDTGLAFFAEAGFRYQMIEPVASFEYFNGHVTGTKLYTTRLGLNFWISKHNYNLKAEVAIPHGEEVDGVAPADDLVGTLQAQASF